MRLAAVFIDAAVGVVPLLVLLPLGIALHSPSITRWAFYAMWLLSPLLLLVNLYLLYRYGQTIGKRVLGLRIVRRDGSRASLGLIFWRRIIAPSAIAAIPGLGVVFSLADALFIFTKSRETLHDRIAATRVIDLRRMPSRPPTAF